MREITSYIFLGAIVVGIVLAAITFFYINKHHKILCDADDTSDKWVEDEKKLDIIESKINNIFKVLYIAQAIFIFTIVDSNWIYEYQLKSYFENGDTLVCEHKGDDIAMFEVSNTNYILKDEDWLIVPTRNLYKKEDLQTSIIDIDWCELKNKKWYQ